MERWKVMIADDEDIIREGIREAVDWALLGMEVVAEAEDGEEALEYALYHAINIALVDLNMPIMHGIDLMKKLREQLPDCKIVVITGHDEFAYAQESIRLQVNDYILKPADSTELTEVMQGVRNELEREQQRTQHQQQTTKQIVKNFPLLRERFCQEWLEGHLSQGEIEEQLHFLQLPIRRPELLGIIKWRWEIHNPGIKENERQLYLYAIENIAIELLSEYPKVIFRDSSGHIVIILWASFGEAVLTRIEQEVRAYLKIAIEIGIEPIEGEISELASSYRRCRVTLSQELPLSPMVRRAKQYMLEHFGEYGITLESTAGILRASPVYLSRLFKQELGTSFGAYLTQIRIRKACQLLNATDLSISEIAEQTGYETQHYFSTSFRKSTGVSPLQYRKGVIPDEDSSS